VHLHNIAHQLSPSVVDAAAAAGVPQVQTLHDYKLLCPVYVLMRGGRPCEECRGGHYGNVVRHRCNRGSWLRSAVNYLETSVHEARGTYHKVKLFLCPSTFQREAVMRFGWPEAQTAFVPHFVQTEGVETSPGRPLAGGFLGRLSPEKGLPTLLEALRLAAPGLPAGWEFLVAGDGEERASLERAASGLPVRFLGALSGDALDGFWRAVRFTVMPSTWYEVRPIAIHEAFARGKSVIGSDLGSIPELVREGETGRLAAAGDPADWARALLAAYADPAAMLDMGRRARAWVAAELTPARHLDTLVSAYRRAAS